MLTILVVGLSVLSARPFAAEDAPACASFAWSVMRERTAFASSDLPGLASGSALPAGLGAARLTLQSAAEIALPLASERTAKPDTYAGFVTAVIPAAGSYQVTLSDEAWVDASQDGHTPLKPAAISGKAGCPDVRKSLRFTLDIGPVTIQLGRVPSSQIKLDLVRVD